MFGTVVLAGAGKMDQVVMVRVLGTHDEPGAAVVKVPTELKLSFEVGLTAVTTK